jgi:hypothetical protein
MDRGKRLARQQQLCDAIWSESLGMYQRMRSLLLPMLLGLCTTVTQPTNRATEGPLQSQIATNLPSIHLDREDHRAVITFTGVLESSSRLDGPWSRMITAVSPLPVDLGLGQSYYRARNPEMPSLFASTRLVDIILTGPFQTHFDLAFAGMPDGIFPPKREKPYFDAKLVMDGTELDVQLRVRGNSSLQECPFPKLKFKVSREERETTWFYDAREIKVGTHCAEGGHGNIGRLRDERATFREAVAYEVMDLLGFVGPRVRRAQIEFRDTSSAADPANMGWNLSRKAFLLDDVEVVAERLGGRALEDWEVAGLTNANFSEQLITDLRFLHALLGNWDFALSSAGAGLWNTEVIELADGRLVPVAGDFDLSSWVTAEIRRRAPREYHPDWAELKRQTYYDLETIRTVANSELFQAAKSRLTAKRVEIEALVRDAEVDEGGRTNALEHVATFFGALEEISN